MLPARHRMRHSGDFARAIRSGARASSKHVVVHLLLTDPEQVPGTDPGGASDPEPTPAEPARVGFVVSKAVGNAVERNLVKRRLRDVMRAEVASLPDGALAVVRALPPAHDATYAELRRDLVRSLEGAARRRQRGGR